MIFDPKNRSKVTCIQCNNDIVDLVPYICPECGGEDYYYNFLLSDPPKCYTCGVLLCEVDSSQIVCSDCRDTSL
jgi:predicted RNA-binding Zn-ribbon protein involved in translation (DUF1610 family)